MASSSACPASYGGVMNKDLYIYQGDDFAIVAEVFQADGVTPVDLTGYTTLAEIRRYYADVSTEVVATLVTALATSSQISISLPKADTALLGGRYVWDLEITSPAGTTTTIAAGAVIALQEVSRP